MSSSSRTTRSRSRTTSGAEFEETSGLELRILQSGDAGELLSKALLTAGNPQGDVLFGLDNNLPSRALEGDLFEPYESPLLDRVDARYVLDPEHRVTPIDHGEVCLNYDKAWFSDREIEPPRSLDDLTTRGSKAFSSSRTRPPRLQGLRSSSRRSRATASRAGRTSGARSGSTRPRRRRLGGGVQRAVHQRRRRQPADRRLLRVEPAGRGDLREPAARGGPHRGRRGQLLPARSSSPGCSGGRGTRREHESSSTSCSRSASRRTSRSRCSSSP